MKLGPDQLLLIYLFLFIFLRSRKSWYSEFSGVQMGHRFSKHRLEGTESLSPGRFSVSEEAPPHYSSYSTGSETAITMDTPTRMPSEVMNSRQDNRRPSIYSTIDAMPHLEFYANATATGRIRRSRPSLETLRKAADVGHVLNNNNKKR